MFNITGGRPSRYFPYNNNYNKKSLVISDG